MKIRINGSINLVGEKQYFLTKKKIFKWIPFSNIWIYSKGIISFNCIYYPQLELANTAIQIYKKFKSEYVSIIYDEKERQFKFIPILNIEFHKTFAKLKNNKYIYDSFGEAYERNIELSQTWIEKEIKL